MTEWVLIVSFYFSGLTIPNFATKAECEMAAKAITVTNTGTSCIPARTFLGAGYRGALEDKLNGN